MIGDKSILFIVLISFFLRTFLEQSNIIIHILKVNIKHQQNIT